MDKGFSDVKSKIMKLLALAEDTRGNEGESQNALLMARRLMAKYNLEISDIQGEVKREVQENATEITFSRRRDAWIGRLAHVVAGAHRCDVLLSVRYRSSTYRVKLIGFKEDLELASMIFKAAYTYVTKTNDSLWRTYEKMGYSAKTLRSIVDSYGIGFSDGLEKKYAEQNSKDENCAALMVLVPTEVENYKYEMSSGSADTSSTHSMNSQAYGIGFSEGKVFNPHSYLESPMLEG